MSDQPFQIGEQVWYVYTSAYSRVSVPCPICFGKLSVKLILGDGSRQLIACDYCGKGFDGPCGIVWGYKAESRVCDGTVTGVSIEDGDWKISLGRSDNRTASHIYRTKAEAEAVSAVELAEAVEQRKAMDESNFLNGAKKHTWSVGYARSEIADAERRIAYHRGRLSSQELRP